MQSALVTRGLRVSYGGLVAVDGVELDVAAGELVGLIGPNGAGKTTTIDAISGFTAHSGTVLLGGRDVSKLAPHRRARAGLSRTWQSVELFADLTVRQHCEIAAHPTGLADLAADLVRPRRRRSDSDVLAALAAVGLGDVADVRAVELPHGTQKLVGVARALAARPQVLLLDEPAAGLDSTESAELGRRLRTLVDSGLAVLLVDHDTELVLDVCDRVHVLDFGAVISSGSPAEVKADTRVIEAYLGVGAHRHGQAPGEAAAT